MHAPRLLRSLPLAPTISLALALTLPTALVLAGCGDDAPASDTTTSDGSESDVTEETETGEALEPITVPDAWVDQLEGLWVGPIDPTPLGPIPEFAMDFERQADGSLRSVTDGGDGTSFEFHFQKDADGGWTVYERGELSPTQVQSHTLHPIAQSGDTITWALLTDPSYLSVDITPGADALVMEVTVLSMAHVDMNLASVGG